MFWGWRFGGKSCRIGGDTGKSGGDFLDDVTLRRAQKGDAEAFEALVTPYEGMIWRVCWHYIGHVEDARDCAQEAMLKAWRSIGAYRRDCSLESWLYRICASVCVDFLRRSRRSEAEPLSAMTEAGFDPPDPAAPPDRQVAERQEREALRRAVAMLPEDMRTVLILYALEKKKYEEIAVITGTAVGTVKSRLNRARQRLQEILSEREQSGEAIVQQSRRRDAR